MILTGISTCGNLWRFPLSIAFAAVTAVTVVFSTPVQSQQVPVDEFVNFESAHVHPLDITPDATRLLAVNTANNTLEVFSIDANGALTNTASIPVGHDPVSVRVRNNNEAWVANVISDTVSIVDLNIGAVVRTLQTQDEPSDIVFAGSPQRAFVSVAERESIQVFNLSNLDAAPQEVLLIGEQPRAMAVSADGQTVFTAFFESGNATTVISGNDFIANGGLNAPFSGTTVVLNDVRNPRGPYGGTVPVPNDGNDFFPALNPALPEKTDTQSLVVKKQADGRWLDDNNGDWTEIVTGGVGERVAGWDMKDRDVAMLDANSLSVSYQSGVGNILMAMSVNPASGDVHVVGTDATNHIRFEPNLNGTFMRHNVSRFSPGSGSVDVVDLNQHLNYSTPAVPNAQKLLSVGDPRAVAWRADGQSAYVSGMGSNNLLVIDSAGNRITAEPINVGEGPTGIVIDESRGFAYVLNKFSASISSVDLQAEEQTSEAFFFDPTPEVIKTGRTHLYNTQTGSGNGTISCASCHVDGKWDRLAWDLGNPAGEMLELNGEQFHPLKGLKTTQSLIDILSSGFPLHWRGDQLEFGDFHLAFQNLKGREPVTEASMREFEAFIGTTYHPPNPYRAETVRSTANLANRIRGPGTSFQNFTMPNFQDGNAVGFWHEACGGCHNNHTGKGPSRSSFRAAQYEGNENLAPDLRLMHKKIGFYYNSDESTVGFGMMSDGVMDTEFFKDQQRTDGYLFDYHGILLGYAGGFTSINPSNTAVIRPPHNSQHSHHAIGEQATINGPLDTTSAVTELLDLANNPATLAAAQMQQDDLGLVVHGLFAGEQRGFVYMGNNLYRSDRQGQTVTHNTLLNAALADNDEPLTWTLVHDHVANRIGVDKDSDGVVNQDDIQDTDNDGVSDESDAFPNDPSESSDNDGDGIGDNADTDDDNDNVPDDVDQMPTDPNESLDSDADGIGNNADTDDDGDGVEDSADAFPLDFNESSDTDGDGLGDNADIDADNDGVVTITEAGGADFDIVTNTLSMASNGSTTTTLIDLSAQGAAIGQRVRLSNLVALGNFRSLTFFGERGFELDVNDGEYNSGTVTSNSNACTLQAVSPAVSADVSVVDIGGGVPGIKVVSTTTSGVDNSCGGPQFELEIGGTASFVADIDGDGVPNDFDLDSDNDSIADVIEAGLSDTDSDYLVDLLTDQGSVTVLPDTDNDGIADIFDRESNNALNDGTAFDIAATAYAAFDTNNDGMVNAADTDGGVDANGNGVDDRFESPVVPAPPTPPTTAPATPAPATSIAIDGDFSDWAGVTAFVGDPDDVSGALNTLDLARAWLAHDSDNLYVRYENHLPEAMQVSWGYSVHLDTDKNRSTGFRGFADEYPIGVDYIIEADSIHRYIGSGTDWAWTAAEVLSNALSANSIELAIPLSSVGNTQSMDVFLYANSAAVGGDAIDFYPDDAANTAAAVSTRAFSYQMDGSVTPPPSNPPPPSSDNNTYSNLATISADGSLGEWASLQSFGSDPDDVTGTGNVLDWLEGWVAHDDTNFYIAWRNDGPAQLSWGNGIMIDADRNSSTGFRGFSGELPIGVDYLLEADVVHRYNGTGTNWDWVDGGSIAPAITGDAVEIAIPRATLGNPDVFDIFFYANNEATQGTAKDFYPDAAGIVAAASNERYFTYSTTESTPPTTTPAVTIAVDGDLSDWPASARLGDDDANEMTPPDTIDWKSVYITASSSEIYLGYESHEPVSLSWGYGILIDTDNNAATGFKGFSAEFDIGAEYIFEANELNRYTGATQTEWSWESVTTRPLAISGNAAEVSFSKADLGNPTSISVVLKGDNSAVGGTGIDFHPDSGVLSVAVNEPQVSPAREAPAFTVGGGSLGLLSLLLFPCLILYRLAGRLVNVAAAMAKSTAGLTTRSTTGTMHQQSDTMRIVKLFFIPVLLLLQGCSDSGNSSTSGNPFASVPNNMPVITDPDNSGQPNANASFIKTMSIALDGGQQLPVVTTPASGNANFTLNTVTGNFEGTIRHSVSGSTAAVIYYGDTAVVQLGRIDETAYRIPAGTTLDETQVQAFENGDMHVIVHSDAYPDGEVRGWMIFRDRAG